MTRGFDLSRHIRRTPRAPALLACLALPAGLALGACSFGPPPTAQGRANAEAVAACRQRADQIYEQQNRGAIYAPMSQVNTPSSASYAPGVSDRELSGLYARDSMIRDCVRNTGAETDRGAAPGVATTP